MLKGFLNKTNIQITYADLYMSCIIKYVG
jgi:hypothetical protein